MLPWASLTRSGGAPLFAFLNLTAAGGSGSSRGDSWTTHRERSCCSPMSESAITQAGRMAGEKTRERGNIAMEAWNHQQR